MVGGERARSCPRRGQPRGLLGPRLPWPGPVSASSSTRCTLRAPACYWILSGRLEERSRSQMKINRSGHVPLAPLRETSVNRRLLQRSVGPLRAALSFPSPDGTDTCTYSSSRAL